MIGREFMGSDRVALILGDNLFYGGGLRPSQAARRRTVGATSSPIRCDDPERYGIVELAADGRSSTLSRSRSDPGRATR